MKGGPLRSAGRYALFVGTTTRWWKEKAPHQTLIEAFRRARDSSASKTREETIRSSLSMYDGVKYGGIGADEYSYAEPPIDPKPINVVRSCTDTIHAEITQTRPRPMALTKGGNFRARQKAKQITKLGEAVLYDSQADEQIGQCARDAILIGTGIAKIWDRNKHLRVTRIMPNTLFVDPVDAYQGSPRTYYYVDQRDRGVLAEEYPEARKAIESASMISSWQGVTGYGSSTTDTYDVVEVIESWRLPSGPNAKDGRHIIATSTGVLFDEEWTDESVPFALMHLSKPMLGFWGIGSGQRLRGIQKRLDTLDASIERALWLLANARVMIPRSSNINVRHFLDNRTGAVTEYDGNNAPSVMNFQAVNPELYAQRDFWIQKAFEEMGVSQMQATSQKPGGLNSGISLRYYADIQSKRFVELAQAYQAFYIEITRQCVRAARRIAKEDGTFTVVHRGKRSIEAIRVADLDIDEDSYVLQVFPISALPGTPAGRLAALQELLQAGTISQETFYRLADFPDLESESELNTAPRDLVDQTLDTIIESGIYLMPLPMQDLNMALRVSVLRFQRARVEGADPDEIEMLLRYMSDVDAMLKDAQGAGPANDPAAAQQADPMAQQALPPQGQAA